MEEKHEVAERFLEQYGSASFPHSEELVGRLVERRDHLTRAMRFGDDRCAHFARIYAERCWAVEFSGKKDSELHREFSYMVEAFEVPPDESCYCWWFQFDDEASFSIWERAESRTIAWCMKRYPFRGTNEDGDVA